MSDSDGNSFIPYGKHSISENDIEEVIKTLRSSFLTQGGKVDEFEVALSRKVGAKYAVAVNSATSALHLSCLALGVTKNDTVWTSPISFVASANCALYCGAKIDFVDINPNTGLMDCKNLKYKLQEALVKNCLPKVVIPVHLGGSSCDMKEIYSLSKKYGFSIIEDASHAIGGKYKNNYVGCCQYSSITVFSFHPVKIITSGEGGIATTNNEEIATKIRNLRSHGIIKDPAKFVFPCKGSWHYEQQLLGFNYRITDIQAALGLSQLDRLDEIVEERNSQLDFYKELFEDLNLYLLNIPNDVRSSVHLAVIKLRKNSPEYYFKHLEGMRSKNIGVQLHYKCIYKQPYFKKFNFKGTLFPGAENYESTSMSIPLFPGLSRKEQIRVKETLRLFL